MIKRPLCFVLMPFGRKSAANGVMVDFDAIYRDVIAPAIEDAHLEPLRADEELTGGIIHKPMFERLVLCEYAVADLTTANANVFYELGLRHGVRRASTLLLFAEGTGQLPFDVALLRGLPYKIGPDGRASDPAAARAAIAKRLEAAREPSVDSPVFQLVEGFPDIKRLKTDVFRDRVEIANGLRQRLREAANAAALRAIEGELAAHPGGIADVDSGVVVGLFLAYRAIKGWKEMVALAAKMAAPLRESVMVQEQLALALSRDGRGEEAERVLSDVIDRHGPSSETYGILGRVYKDRWDAAVKTGDAFLARGLLDKAIGAYLAGFEADWRDAYPGINAVTLMELRDPPDPRRAALLPVVAFAVERRIAAGKPDYWDYATKLELAVLSNDEPAADAALSAALAAVREVWEPETTARNLRLIGDARARRGESAALAAEVEKALLAKPRP